jgi:hypothetical protein
MKTFTPLLLQPGPVTLKPSSMFTVADAATRLDQLIDVDATAESNGSTLVYNNVLDKYIVKKISFDEVDGDLDGGTF